MVRANTLLLLKSLLLFSSEATDLRFLQQELPDYTSPPTPESLEATPEGYRSDGIIDAIRDQDAAGNCTAEVGSRCHIPFPGEPTSQVGVVLYAGGLVDPRGYSKLASLLATRYGLPTVIPIFTADLAFVFGVCDSGRLEFAKAEFPSVEKWVLAGHSFGGIAAITDMWERWNADDESAAGLVLMAADIQQDIGCGAIDFSETNLAMASLTGSEDRVLNKTRWESNKGFVSNDTLFIEIFGASHASYASYDASGRFDALGQVDGDALIPSFVVWDIAAAAVAHVAARTGVELPSVSEPVVADAGEEEVEPDTAEEEDGEMVTVDRCNPTITEGASETATSSSRRLDVGVSWTTVALGACMLLAL